MMKYAVPLAVLMTGLASNIGLCGSVGEPAPPLLVKEWVKGKPVEIKVGTNIYVVEIWNVSSAACRACITNLNNLQKRFATNGVVIVGISDEPVEKIKEFVEHDGTNIEYAIAADDKRQTSLGYMLPLGRRSIPYAFVVGTNGSVLWHGHPLHGLDKALDQIIVGQYDLERAKKMEVANYQMQQYLDLARRGNDRAVPAGRVLLAARTNDVDLLCDLAFQISTFPHIAKRDFVLAGEALDQAEKLATTNTVRVMINRAIMLFESGKRDEGLARARQTLASAQNQDEKTNIQLVIRTMENRLAEIKSHQSNTNQTNTALTSDQSDKVPVANTNQSDTNRSKEPVGNP